MAMTWTSLTSPKGTSGSIMNWVNYSKLDINPVVDEAQALIYSLLRCREMRTKFSFRMAQGSSAIALPSRFLDPIGRIFVPSYNIEFKRKDEGFVLSNRNYTETSGTLGTNPLTTTNGSTQVSVNLPGHGFSQESSFNISGSTAVGGITPNGTFDIVSVTDANNFVVDTLTMTASAGATGGGSAIAYVCDNLAPGSPQNFGIWDEMLHFDAAFTQGSTCQLLYYQSLPLLSNTNQSNFLTNRYPQVMRTACQAAAADFQKDDTEYQKCVARLTALIQTVAVENDGEYRGMELETETP